LTNTTSSVPLRSGYNPQYTALDALFPLLCLLLYLLLCAEVIMISYYCAIAKCAEIQPSDARRAAAGGLMRGERPSDARRAAKIRFILFACSNYTPAGNPQHFERVLY
jgi:hypothetical protein